MAKKQWSVDIDGTIYEVAFDRNQWSGKQRLRINGESVLLDRTPFQAFVGLDQGVYLGDKECRFVVIGNKADIVVDGVFIESRKPYLPFNKIPWWVWIFVVACIAIPIVSLGGVIPAALGILGSSYCVRIAVSPEMKTIEKLFICLGITAIAWVLWVLLIFAISSL